MMEMMGLTWKLRIRQIHVSSGDREMALIATPHVVYHVACIIVIHENALETSADYLVLRHFLLKVPSGATSLKHCCFVLRFTGTFSESRYMMFIYFRNFKYSYTYYTASYVRSRPLKY